MIGFLKQNFRWIAGGALLTFASSFGQTFFVSGASAEWRALFGLSDGQFGTLYMIATLCSALSLPFIGRLVDVWPEHKVIMLTIPVLAFACLLAAYAPNVLVLGFAIYLLRLFGQGMMSHIAITATGRWFAAQRGRAMSLVVLGHQGGEAILPSLYVAISLAAGWQMAWTLGAGALLLIALPIAVTAFRVPRTPRGHAPEIETEARNWTRAEALRDPIFWVLLMGVLAPPFIGTTIFFHQDYLTAYRGWPAALFATGFTAMALTTVCFALICGALIDRFGARRILPFFLIPLSSACFSASVIESGTGLYVFMILLGVSYGFSSTLFGSLWPEIYGTKHLGAIRSVMMPFMVFATAAGPGITGTLIDRGVSLPTQLLAMGSYCLIACVIMGFASWRLRHR
ncbi:MFS transporter [Parvularcula marina]|uniref:MFS transporter n=1 Tax=Parvularcula marina TaxID=2292771 RepID=A0A371RFA5_9PROT|nr:MFS transporter [Parvularcula marina]RFB04141.1 MFS transporter [Parvularcula marina]